MSEEQLKPLRKDECLRIASLFYALGVGAKLERLTKAGHWVPDFCSNRSVARYPWRHRVKEHERMNEISGYDAIAEGIEPFKIDLGGAIITTFRDYLNNRIDRAAHQSYRSLWESINGPGSWGENPFVWVVEFRRVEGRAA